MSNTLQKNHLMRKYKIVPEQLNNRPQLRTFRKSLRNNSTKAEVVLWKYLRNKQLEGRKFRRQHSFGNYIMDFYCTSEKLCVELDGAHHYTKEGLKYDGIRSNFLNREGIQVIRFENEIVLKRIDLVLDEIRGRFK